MIKSKTNHIINRGTGAGGANTTKNGLSYEELTNLDDMFKVISTNKKLYYKKIQFNGTTQIFVQANGSGLFKYLESEKDDTVGDANGCKRPDECYIYEATKLLIIIEKKFQQRSGSVCEKIQSTDFKRWQYGRMFPGYRIKYIYCLSNWFKNNCKEELIYFKENGIRVFWGESTHYKERIIKYLISCTQ